MALPRSAGASRKLHNTRNGSNEPDKGAATRNHARMRLSLIGALVVVTACKGKEQPAAQNDPWASKGEPAAPAATNSGGEKKWYQTTQAPVGVWMGLDERMSATGLVEGNALATTLRLTTMVVWPDGHLSEDAPWAGLADFDYATWARDVQTNRSLGGSPATYTPDGDGWSIKFDSGYEQSMKMDGDFLRYRKAKLERAADVTGATLDGVYTWWSKPEDPSLSGPGCQQLVRFTRDGKFENRGGFALTCPAGATDPGRPGSGTYEIRDFSLILRYDDGRTDKKLITARQNSDLHTDISHAIIMGRVWSQRTSPTDTAPVPSTPSTAPTPTPTPPPTAPVTADGMTTYDAVTFSTPPGEEVRNKTSVSFTAKEGDGFCMTAVFAGVPSIGTLLNDFKADWKDIVLNGRTADEKPVPKGAQTPTGLTFAMGSSMTTERDSSRVFRALFVLLVGSKRVSVMAVAPTEQQLATCHLETLLASIKGA